MALRVDSPIGQTSFGGKALAFMQSLFERKVEKGAAKAKPISPVMSPPPKAVEVVEEPLKKSLPTYGNGTTPNALMCVKVVNHQELPCLEKRARAYVLKLARERGCREVFFGPYEEGFSAIFAEEPLDAYLVIDPPPGGNCHPLYGVTIRKLQVVPAICLETIQVAV